MLAANELIKEIRIPLVPGGKTASAFLRLTSRRGQDIAQASAAVRLTLDGDVCRNAVIAMGSVSKVTVRAYSLEKAVAGKKVAEAAAQIKGMVPAEVALRATDKPGLRRKADGEHRAAIQGGGHRRHRGARHDDRLRRDSGRETVT